MSQPSCTVDRARVDALMERSGFATYTDLGIASGVHPNTLVRLLQGGGWQSNTLEALAVTLMCHPFDMLLAKGFPRPSLGTLGEELAQPEGVSNGGIDERRA